MKTTYEKLIAALWARDATVRLPNGDVGRLEAAFVADGVALVLVRFAALHFRDGLAYIEPEWLLQAVRLA